jgi:hypothetical protein
MGLRRIVRAVALVGVGVVVSYMAGVLAGHAIPPPSAAWAAGSAADSSANKIVPILSVGEGIQVGVAQVRGPASRVKKVQAVAELDTHFKDVLQIEIYVPISTKVPGKKLARVQGVGVFATAAYKATGH